MKEWRGTKGEGRNSSRNGQKKRIIMPRTGPIKIDGSRPGADLLDLNLGGGTIRAPQSDGRSPWRFFSRKKADLGILIIAHSFLDQIMSFWYVFDAMEWLYNFGFDYQKGKC